MLCRCKFTPLQSRLLASVTALALLAIIYWSLANPHFAYAAELPLDGTGQLRSGEDHNWHRIRDDLSLDEEQDVLGEDKRNIHVGRATTQTQVKGNNIGTTYDADAGSLAIWEYPNRFLVEGHTSAGSGLPSDMTARKQVVWKHGELRRREEEPLLDARQDSNVQRTIYISANTCQQPVYSGSGVQTSAAPQLTLYVSTQAENKDLGPNGNNQQVYEFNKGFVNASISASGNWYLAVAAPSLPSNFTGTWSYELAVSIDGYFHAADEKDSFLFLVDTDYDSALLVTDNLTQADSSSSVFQSWMNLTAPFTMFAINRDFTGIMGMENSFCGLQNFVNGSHQIAASQKDLQGNFTNVEMGMITRGLGNKPKQQFYATALNHSSQYTAFLAMAGNSTDAGDGVVGGGGKVWGIGTSFSTKSDGNCQLLFNLTFCNEVAYAVPFNPNIYNNKSSFANLQSFYENYTTTWWRPFNHTLAQIPCNTTSQAQYSLAKNCTDCAAAYKEWLCAVSIPRCEDFSNPAPYLQVRNVGQPFYNNNTMLEDPFLQTNYVPMPGAPTIQGSNAFAQTYISSFATNQSRNAMIDRVIQPGPYKEVLPCEDLCYSLMQSCPASMNFACPYPGRGLEASYGKRNFTPGQLTCSYLGAVYYQNDVGRLGAQVFMVLGFAVVATGLVMAFT